MRIKLGDFGLATKLNYASQRKYSFCGTPDYIAPEILQNRKGYSYEVDIWSMGVVLYTLIVGIPPFQTNEERFTYEKITKCIYSFPDEQIKISANAKDLITKILNLDPTK